MSDSINTELLERAAEAIDYFGDTTIGKTIQNDIDRNDLEILVTHVAIAEAQMAQQEFMDANIV